MSCISNSLRTVVPVVSMPTYVVKESDFSKKRFKVFATALLGCLAVGGIAFGSSYGFYRLYKAANVASQLRDLSRAAMGISATIGVVAIALHVLRGSCTGISAYHSHRGTEDFGKGSGQKRELGSGYSNLSSSYTSSVDHKKILADGWASTGEDFFEKIQAFFSKGEITRKGVQARRNALGAMQNLCQERQFEEKIRYFNEVLDLCDEYLDLEEEVQASEQGTTEEKKCFYNERLDSIRLNCINTHAPSLLSSNISKSVAVCMGNFHRTIETMINALPVVEEGEEGDKQNNHNASSIVDKLREEHAKGRVLTAKDEEDMEKFVNEVSKKGVNISDAFNASKDSGSESSSDGNLGIYS